MAPRSDPAAARARAARAGAGDRDPWAEPRDLHDWIVTNLTLEALGAFAEDDGQLRDELVSILRGRLSSERKSIASRARKLLARLT
jgi:hypothetical protein